MGLRREVNIFGRVRRKVQIVTSFTFTSMVRFQVVNFTTAAPPPHTHFPGVIRIYKVERPPAAARGKKKQLGGCLMLVEQR